MRGPFGIIIKENGVFRPFTTEENQDFENYKRKWENHVPDRLELVLMATAQFALDMHHPIHLFSEFNVRENAEWIISRPWMMKRRYRRRPNETKEERWARIDEIMRPLEEQFLRIVTDNEMLANLTRADLAQLPGFDDEIITCMEPSILLLRRQLELYADPALGQ